MGRRLHATRRMVLWSDDGDDVTHRNAWRWRDTRSFSSGMFGSGGLESEGCRRETLAGVR